MKQSGLHNNGGRSADFYPGLTALVGCRNVFLPEPELQLSLPPQSCSAFLSNYPRVQSTSSFWTAARILSNCPPPPPPLPPPPPSPFDLCFTKIPGLEVAWQRWRRLSAAPANTAEVAGGTQPKLPSKRAREACWVFSGHGCQLLSHL